PAWRSLCGEVYHQRESAGTSALRVEEPMEPPLFQRDSHQEKLKPESSCCPLSGCLIWKILPRAGQPKDGPPAKERKHETSEQGSCSLRIRAKHGSPRDAGPGGAMLKRQVGGELRTHTQWNSDHSR